MLCVEVGVVAMQGLPLHSSRTRISARGFRLREQAGNSLRASDDLGRCG